MIKTLIIEYMNYIACKIHNNSLGKTIAVDSETMGKALIQTWAEEQFGRPLTDEEINNLDDTLEIYNDEDSDNIYTFSLGIVE